jgi:hypothetical protein
VRGDRSTDGRSQSDTVVGCIVWSTTPNSADSASRSSWFRNRPLNASTVLAGVGATKQHRQQPIGQGAADDPIDLIEPIAQDRDPNGDRDASDGDQQGDPHPAPLGAQQALHDWAEQLTGEDHHDGEPRRKAVTMGRIMAGEGQPHPRRGAGAHGM